MAPNATVSQSPTVRNRPLGLLDFAGRGLHGENTFPEFEEVLVGSDSTAGGCLGCDPGSVMALEDQLVVQAADVPDLEL